MDMMMGESLGMRYLSESSLKLKTRIRTRSAPLCLLTTN